MTPASQQSRPPLTTKAELAEALGMPLRKLNYWFHVLPADRRYTRFELQRSGDRPPRVIEAPIRPIKDIQRRVLAIISAYYTAHHAVHGYIAGRSIITNARVHLHQRWVFRIDLADFFPSINFGRVRGRFMASPFGCPPDVATLLAQICCHDNHLPQGAPTSPLVSNLICRRLDRQLGELAKADRCFYSRYCDDLIFSTTRQAFPVALATTDIQTGAIVAAPPVRAVISSNGFTINDAKTRLRHYSQRQVVTGLVTNQILNVPRDYVRSLRFLLHIWKSHGEAAAAAALVRHRPENRAPSRPPVDFRLSVRGKVQYLGSVKGWDDPVYTALAAKLHLMDERFFLPERILGGPPTTCFIFAEGKTDHIHLQSALAHFQSAGRFNDLVLRHDDKRTGEQDILRACEEMAKSPHDQPAPTIFVFDRDSPGIIPKVTAPPALFKEWRRNLFSFALPTPWHRAGTDVFCIEMLYPDEVLQRRENGRRIYLRSEFEEGGRHRTEAVFCNNWKSRGLVREDDAMSSTTGQRVCLSKNAFAQAVSNRNPPFEHVSFEGFLPVLEALAAIRTHVLAQSH